MEPTAPSRRGAALRPRESTDDARAETFRRLARAFRRNRPDEITNTFRQIVASYSRPNDVVRLKRIFTQAERLDLLLDLLLLETRAFTSAALISETLVLASVLGRDNDATRWLERQNAINNDSTLRWENSDYVRQFVPERRSVGEKLRALKYPDLPSIRSSAELIRYAETVAKRVVIEPAFLDQIYPYSKFPLARNIWEKRVKIAFAIDHIVTDTDLDPDWHIVLDRTASRQALDLPDNKKGTLFLVTHGGFIGLIVAWLMDAAPDLLITACEEDRARPRNVEQVFAGEDTRATLFALYKALIQQRAVLIAPDAPLGALKSSINVLGLTRQIPDGAAFLAYETGCNTAWCAVEREDDRFMPRLTIFPGRGQTESYPDFKKRFFEFYAAQVEALLTGSPDNLTVRPGWVNTFARVATP